MPKKALLSSAISKVSKNRKTINYVSNETNRINGLANRIEELETANTALLDEVDGIYLLNTSLVNRLEKLETANTAMQTHTHKYEDTTIENGVESNITKDTEGITEC